MASGEQRSNKEKKKPKKDKPKSSAAAPSPFGEKSGGHGKDRPAPKK